MLRDQPPGACGMRSRRLPPLAPPAHANAIAPQISRLPQFGVAPHDVGVPGSSQPGQCSPAPVKTNSGEGLAANAGGSCAAAAWPDHTSSAPPGAPRQPPPCFFTSFAGPGHPAGDAGRGGVRVPLVHFQAGELWGRVLCLDLPPLSLQAIPLGWARPCL